MNDTGYTITPPHSRKYYHQHATNIRKEADRDEEMGILYAAQYILMKTIADPVQVDEIDVKRPPRTLIDKIPIAFPNKPTQWCRFKVCLLTAAPFLRRLRKPGAN
jgi:hypothetical protein